jgi:putative transposase
VKIRRSKRLHRIQGRPLSVTLKKEGTRWYASVACEVEMADPHPLPELPQLRTVGLDRGVAISVALSTGESFHTPQFTPKEAERLTRLQRKLARQVKGSKSRAQTKEQISDLWARLRRRRQDAIHKFTDRLVQNHDLIVIEKLPVKNLTKSARGTKEKPGKRVRQKAGLNRAILSQCWGEIRRQLLYKARWAGKVVLEVPPQYTSQTCARCDTVHAESRVSQAEFCCTECGWRINADLSEASECPQLHAALVIDALGVRVYAGAGTAEADAVRPEALVQAPASVGGASRGSPSGKAGQNPRP